MKKKIFLFVVLFLLLFSVTGCGNKMTTGSGKTDEKKITYYEECNKLPQLENAIEYQNMHKSTILTGTSITTYKYSPKDVSLDDGMKKYLDFLKKQGIEYRDGSDDNSYAIIINEEIVAEVFKDEEDTKINVKIFPAESRLSSKIIDIKLGDTIKTSEYEFTLNQVEFTYEVLPPNTSGWYTSYPADKGKVYINVVAHMKNLMKRDIRIEELYTSSATYANNYKYQGFTIVADDDGFDYNDNYTAATPLETVKTHMLIECPEEVYTSSEPVYVSIVLSDGITYKYQIR